ncbi:MAG: hypothetical protein RL755_675 [Pseudomonadota bacterium]
MALSENTRLHYLTALGITVWQSRTVEASPVLAEMPSPSTRIEPHSLAVDSWETLRSQVAQCERCTLCTTRTNTVFGEGNPNAKWFFIGEAPGQEEDLQGKPFVGEAGKLLTEMLRAMQLTREEVFIANILKCRPPHNRDPHADEIHACRDYLFEQIALINPKMIVAVGRISAQTLLETHDPIGKLRGKVHHFQEKPLIAIYHPAYLLRTPIEKRKAWQDLQFALRSFKGII